MEAKNFRLGRWIDEHFEEAIMIVLLIAISVVMLAQIFARYILNSSMTWPEEFSRYCYVWTVFLSLSYTIRKGNMLRVGVVADLLPAKVQSTLKILIDLIMLGLFALFCKEAVSVVLHIKNNTGELSAAMRFPMWIMYLCTVTGFGLSVIRCAQSAYFDIKNFGVKGESTIEATLKEAQAEAELARQDDEAFRKENSEGGDA